MDARSALYSIYRFLPHALINRGARFLAQREHPRAIVQTALGLWARRAHLELHEAEARDYRSVEDLFLRRLVPGARPLDAASVVSPVDGEVIASGTITREQTYAIKGAALGLQRLVNGRLHQLVLEPYLQGRYVSLFLSPRGYHFIHMPFDGMLVSSQYLPGRAYPQNPRALRIISRVYERNERLVLRLRADAGFEALMILVGASLIGGIALGDVPRVRWMRRQPTSLDLRRERGAEVGHFTFGSTVLLLLPAAFGPARLPREGDTLRMGQTLVA